MDVESFGEGGKKGKKQGDGKCAKKGGKGQTQCQNPNTNKEVVCWHCGTKMPPQYGMLVEPKEPVWFRRRSTQRRQRTTEQQRRQGRVSWNMGDQAAAAEQQPQLALASSLDWASFEKTGRSSHLDAEGWLEDSTNRLKRSQMNLVQSVCIWRMVHTPHTPKSSDTCRRETTKSIVQCMRHNSREPSAPSKP